MKGIKLIFLILVAMLLILGCQQSPTTDTTSPTNTSPTTTTTKTTIIVTPIVGNKIYDLAPDFHLQDLEGNTVSLSDFRGSPVIIKFWRIN